MAGGRLRDPAGLGARKLLAALDGSGWAYGELYLGGRGSRLHVGVERSKSPRQRELRSRVDPPAVKQADTARGTQKRRGK